MDSVGHCLGAASGQNVWEGAICILYSPVAVATGWQWLISLRAVNREADSTTGALEDGMLGTWFTMRGGLWEDVQNNVLQRMRQLTGTQCILSFKVLRASIVWCKPLSSFCREQVVPFFSFRADLAHQRYWCSALEVTFTFSWRSYPERLTVSAGTFPWGK